MKYRDIDIGMAVRLIPKNMRERWGDCRVVDKTVHGILTLEEIGKTKRTRHYANAGRVTLIGEGDGDGN